MLRVGRVRNGPWQVHGHGSHWFPARGLQGGGDHGREQTGVRGTLASGVPGADSCVEGDSDFRCGQCWYKACSCLLNTQPQRRHGNTLRFAFRTGCGHSPFPLAPPGRGALPGLLRLPLTALGSRMKPQGLCCARPRGSHGNLEGKAHARREGAWMPPNRWQVWGRPVHSHGPSPPGHWHPYVLPGGGGCLAQGRAHMHPEQAWLLPSFSGLGTHTAASGSRGA